MAVPPTHEVTLEDRQSTRFVVPTNMQLVKKIGSGAYGKVASFRNKDSGEVVAVKKIADAFNDLIDGKRILREIMLLRQLHHDNIIQILDMYAPPGPDFDDIYVVTDLLETDLHKVIYSKQPLSDEHAQYFIYQILRGLLYLHSAGVLHRDLKPANILLNKNCDLKICDFGLARAFTVRKSEDDDADDDVLTDYVVTRWYRAPEVVLSASEYTEAIDVWSVGCILCEILGRKPLFHGQNHLDQIKKIVERMGFPVGEELAWLTGHDQSLEFLERCPRSAGTPLEHLYPEASPGSLELARAMLRFSPRTRTTVRDALRHIYLKEMHVPSDEPVADALVDWSFDRFEPTKRALQNRVYLVCARFHELILERDAALLEARGIADLIARQADD